MINWQLYKYIQNKSFILFVLSLAFPLTIHAVDVQFHGILIDNPPCNVGSNGPIEVEFGYIGISNINGDNYKKNFLVKFSCEDIIRLLYISAMTVYQRYLITKHFRRVN